MGNFFDKPTHEDGQAVDTNGEETSTKNEHAYYLTDLEKRQLRLIYEMIFTEQNGVPNKEGLKVALQNEPNQLILNSIYMWLASKEIHAFQDFQGLILTSARYSANETITAMWDLVRFCKREGEEDHDKTTLFLFCRFTLLIVSEEVDIVDIGLVDEEAEQLHSFLIASARRADPDADIDNNLDRFISVVLEFIPHVAKAFHTYLSVRLLLAGDSPSFKPYLPPSLSNKSETATQLALNSLALHCEELQSDWKRIYSTTSDGLSFNRICHHVLGYEVCS
jgi:hypothetical protein